MIRQASSADVPAIVSMSRKFYETTNYAKTTPFDADTVWDLAEMLASTSVMLIAECEGVAVGMIGVLIAPDLFNRNHLTSTEIVFWVDPNFTGQSLGKKLLRAADEARKARGARKFQMVALATSPPQVAMMYEREGFTLSETSHTKVD